MTEKTITELMAREGFAETRLDAIVAPLMRQADHMATCRAMAAQFENTGGDVDAYYAARKQLSADLRAAFTKLVGEVVLLCPSQREGTT